MARSRQICWVIPFAIVAVVFATGMTDIKPTEKHAWCENIGWSNWRDANGATSGISVLENTLAGWMWFENIGWCSVASGSPGANGYDNLTGNDYGVNILSNDRLDGFGWCENAGWLRFDAQLDVALAPRLDRLTGRLRGYAWGENVGWMNLDDSEHFIAVNDSPDADLDGDVDLLDFAAFQACFGWEISGGQTCVVDTDFDDDGDTDLDDWLVFADQLNGPSE